MQAAQNPLITIFTAPKPFRDEHITTIQMNAIRSWQQLGQRVSILLVGDEEGVQEFAQDFKLGYVPSVARNKLGTPLISSIFDIGRKFNDSPLLAYVNADILLFEDFVHVADRIATQIDQFLIVGQRYDLDVQKKLEFEADWQQGLKKQLSSMGHLHPPGGSDYFIYPRQCFTNIPDFAVGRAGWDNWMFYQARRNNWHVVDATASIQIIHQNHDYSHLPGGQSHYRLPETGENVRLAGGQRTIFTLFDANYVFQEDVVKKYPLSWAKFWREVEIFPLITLKSFTLAQVNFAIFHPLKAWKELRNWWHLRFHARKALK